MQADLVGVEPSDATRPVTEKEKACDELIDAINKGKMGETIAKHEQLILAYYDDVQKEAKQSFASAKTVAWIGFGVLIMTWVYALVFDALSRFPNLKLISDAALLKVAGIGVVSGALIEFVSGINFWLYSRCSRQFGAFHICLERTHRYLLAYKIAEEIKENRDKTIRDLVCIMANASMITPADMEPDAKRFHILKDRRIDTLSAGVEKQIAQTSFHAPDD